MIGRGNFRHPVNQSDVNLKPVVSLLVFNLSFYWPLVPFPFPLMGGCDSFGFGFRTIKKKKAKRFGSLIVWCDC